MTLQGQQVHSPPSIPPPTVHTECSGANSLSLFPSKHVSVKEDKGKRTFQESWEEKYFCYAQDDNVRCLLCLKVQKGIHKWNIKRIMIPYSVASPPLTLPTYPFSHYVMCIAGCVVRRHHEATLSTGVPIPDASYNYMRNELNNMKF